MNLPPLGELEAAGGFLRRHVGPDEADRERMLERLGYERVEELLDTAVPEAIRSTRPFELPAPLSEQAVLDELRSMEAENERWTSLIGMGFHGTVTPPVIRRNVLENPAWYTAYTPYQPEISQGRLEALINFQTMVSDLTALPVANASLLDEASAAAEAMSMCLAASGEKGRPFFVDRRCHPQTVEVVETRARARGIAVVVGDPLADLGRVEPFAALLQHPATDGELRDLQPVIAEVHERGGRAVVAADLLSLALLVPPGELGADVAVGSTQRFGVPLFYGGPHAAYLSARADLTRLLPGRLVGVSVDAEGREALRLALQTREQHIRRERATSNICTAQALLAVVAGLYAAYHGPEGLRAIALRVHRLTATLVEGLRRAGHRVKTERYFDAVAVQTDGRTDEVLAAARARRVNLRRLDDFTVGINLDETSGAGTVELVWSIFSAKQSFAEVDASARSPIPEGWWRTSEYLTHPVFRRYHSETAMLRYLRLLSDRDLALDRSMIPLGSCTMKLNAAAEMEPISWPGFADLHPFAPLDQARGYHRLMGDLEAWLAELSGYDAVSLQPNAGSQGELAGLLAIRGYQEGRGEPSRRICLLPTSAHGTNAASAAMAGLTVVPVACDEAGSVDLDDLGAKLDAEGERVAAIMLTYPSTHGVYEESVADICTMVHEAGGQVYIDGANLNALLGITRLAEVGGDVSHFNLHKTFCIPHGGGGPGVGPIGVGAHLAPFLPGHPAHSGQDHEQGTVSAAPWGSAGILPITWMYLAMMGGAGLKRATEVALLNANYLAARLKEHFPVLYVGTRGRVAHECIIDIRPQKAATGITETDIAKRLMDYGFHAPTVSFPVAGTLMIEPTESESKAELDRFVSAMIGIRNEIRMVEEGVYPAEDNPLKNAPHTQADLAAADWTHPYSREVACFPSPEVAQNKFWPTVGRIDDVYGDRNLCCSLS